MCECVSVRVYKMRQRERARERAREREREHTLGSLGTFPDISVFHSHMLKLLSRWRSSWSTTTLQGRTV